MGYVECCVEVIFTDKDGKKKGRRIENATKKRVHKSGTTGLAMLEEEGRGERVVIW